MIHEYLFEIWLFLNVINSLQKPNISGIFHIVKTHKALCEGYVQPKASFRTCRSVSYPEIFLGHDYVSRDLRNGLLMIFLDRIGL